MTEREPPRSQTEIVPRGLNEIKQKIKDDKFSDQLDKYMDSDNKIFMSQSSGSRQQLPQKASDIMAKAKQLVEAHSNAGKSEIKSEKPEDVYAGDTVMKNLALPVTTSSVAASTPKRHLTTDVQEEEKHTDDFGVTDGPPTKRSEPMVQSSHATPDRSIGETPKFIKDPVMK